MLKKIRKKQYLGLNRDCCWEMRLSRTNPAWPVQIAAGQGVSGVGTPSVFVSLLFTWKTKLSTHTASCFSQGLQLVLGAPHHCGTEERLHRALNTSAGALCLDIRVTLIKCSLPPSAEPPR